MPSNYSKFTITSIPDPHSGGLSIPDYERDMKTIVNQAVKSALSEGGYLKTSSRVVDKSTGATSIDVYVHTEDARVVADSLRTELDKLSYKDFGANKSPKYEYVASTPSDKEQRALAREEARGGESGETVRFNKGTLLKIVGILTTIADITRRILSSVLTFSAQAVRDSVTAHNLGMSYEAVRAYRHTEAQHGLKEGTITDAIAGEQQKYGNITSLDEKSLEYIALIMGNKVADMATMGLGASNPEAIMSAIVDRANELANSGYNSVGQYVGEQQARRELYSYLLKYSPQIADIFATMQEEQHNINSLFRNQAETFEQWKNILPTARGGHNKMDYNVTVTMGKEWDVVKDVFNQMKEGLAVTLAPAVLELLRKIADSRVGMTEKEKQERNKENRASNLRELANVNKTLKESEADWANLSPTDKALYFALKQYKEELERANKGNLFTGNIPYAVRTPEELRVLANQMTRADYRNTGAYGTNIAPTASEIQDVVEGYGKFDLNKERNKYKAQLEKQKKARIAEETDVYAKAENIAYNAVFEDENSPYYLSTSQRANPSLSSATRTLALLEALYPNVKLSGDNVYAKLKDAVAKGIAYFSSTDKVKTIPYVKKRTATNIEQMQAKNKAEAEFAYDEEDFLYWLYGLNASYFNEKIMGVRADEMIAESVEGSRLASKRMLDISEGTKTDWRSKIPSTYTGGGKLIGYNDVSGGEVVHRIVLAIDNKEYELGSYEGMQGYKGTIGTVNVVNDNGKTSYNVSLGTGASIEQHY